MSALARLRRKPPRPYPGLAGRGGIDSGVHRLIETPLVANGSEASTILRFPLHNASASGLPEYGGAGTLALQAGTAPTYDQPGAFLGSLDNGTLFNAGGYFAAGNNTLGDVDAEDGIDEMLFRFGTGGGTMAIAGKNNTSNNGVHFYQSATTLHMLLGSGGSYVHASSAGALTPGGIYLVHGIWDKSGSAILYVTAVAGAPGVISALGSFSIANPLAVGARTGGGIPFNEDVFYYARHLKSGWLDTHLQPDLAKERVALVTGSRPLISIASTTSLAACGTTSPAYQERTVSGAQRLYQMGPSAPRYVQKTDANGADFTGMCIEGGATNGFAYNNVGASWTNVALCSSTDGQTDPAGGTAAIRCVLIANTGQLHIGENVDMGEALANKPISMSGWVKRVSGGTQVYFACVDCTSWANGGREEAVTIPDVWTPVKSLATFQATAAGQTANMRFGTQSNKGGSNLPAITFDVWLPQFTLNEDHPSSSIKVPSTALVTRAADSPHRISGASHFGPKGFALWGEVLCHAFTPTRNHHLWTAYKSGAAATEHVKCFVDTAGKLNVQSATAGGDSGAVITASAINNNVVRAYCVSFEQGRLRLWVNGAEATPDTVVDLVAGLDTLDWGTDEAGANHAGPGVLPGARYQLVPHPVADPLPEPGGFAL